MFMILNVILMIVIYIIDTNKDNKFKIGHLILIPFVIVSSLPGSIGLTIYIVVSNGRTILKWINKDLS